MCRAAWSVLAPKQGDVSWNLDGRGCYPPPSDRVAVNSQARLCAGSFLSFLVIRELENMERATGLKA